MKKILIIHHHGKFGGSSKSISEYINLLKKNLISKSFPHLEVHIHFLKKINLRFTV